MGAFILAIIVFVIALILASFTAFAQGMVTAPRYDDTPWNILRWGVVISLIIAASHWLPNIGW